MAQLWGSIFLVIASTSAIAQIVADDMTQVSRTRIDRTTFLHEFIVTARNEGGNARAIIGNATSLIPGIVIADDTLDFGNISAGELAVSQDTFSARIDRSVPFDSANIQIAFSSSVGEPPTGLSYPAVPQLQVGRSLELEPTVAGRVDSYDVDPALPAGLELDAATGIISGAPTAPAVPGDYTITASNNNGDSATTISFSVHATARPVLQLSATATDANGDPLSFEWRVTDGNLRPATGPEVQWTLEHGPGLHFAYVLVNDGKGGYTERRVAVSTDDFGTLRVARGGPAIAAPAAADVPGSILRGHIRERAEWDPAEEFVPNTTRKVHPAKLWGRAVLRDSDNNIVEVLSDLIQADAKGDLAIPKIARASVPDGAWVDVDCSVDAGATFVSCESFQITDRAETDYVGLEISTGSPTTSPLLVFGNVSQADGTRCGTRNYFFEKDVAATARVTDPQGNPIGQDRDWSVNAWGDYYIPLNLPPELRPMDARVDLGCESAQEVRMVTLPTYDETDPDRRDSDALFIDFQLPNTSPEVTALTASLNGVVVAALAPPAPPRPSDGIEDPERFLSYKGIDSRQSACEYYRAIGAASGCDARGRLRNGITFDRWKRTHGIAPFNTTPEYSATFVNQVDLNLTRVHRGTRVGPDHLAFVVCNYLGPKDESQEEIDAAIDNAMSGRNLVACVAMDYSVSPGVNSDEPFIKYLIFSGSGKLLPSINLDGRREKFAPGVCVGCHGGENYAGRYPEDGTGVANVGAHYLPWDVDNFAFSSRVGLRKEDQLAQIRQLNELLLETEPVQGLTDLITAWYAHGGDAPDESYVPRNYLNSPEATAYYQKVVKPYCRTCHVAYVEKNSESGLIVTHNGLICGADDQTFRDNSMPNSLVTYDLMANDLVAIEAYLDYKYRNDPDSRSDCNPPTPTNIWPGD